MNNNRLIFATGNEHKILEIKEAIGNSFEILGIRDLGFTGEIEEPYETLRENALVKADFFHNRYHLPCFADDTGLEIDALGGKPGVYSARYAGPECNSTDNIRKVLEQMKNQEIRTAHFKTVIALIIDGENHFFEGIVKGEILSEPQGDDGFGYDPIFRPFGHDLTFAQMPLSIKNSISHRGQAVKALINFLKQRMD